MVDDTIVGGIGQPLNVLAKSELMTAHISRFRPKLLAPPINGISVNRSFARFTWILIVPIAHPQTCAASTYEKPDTSIRISDLRGSEGRNFHLRGVRRFRFDGTSFSAGSYCRHPLPMSPFQGRTSSMSKSHVVAQHVPYLRRYARALTGSQVSGDSYVATTLDALVKEPSLIDTASHPRVALFRVFSAIWNSVDVNGNADRIVDPAPAERHLGQITAMPRQAFLLVSVEGFSEDDAAMILDIDRQTLQHLIEESGRELATQIATDILIIEDEPFIALDLEKLVERLGHRTVGIARTRSEAISLSNTNRPGLILADIQLADGSSGLEAVNDLLNSFEAPVIFITAYPERVLTGDRPEPAFLVSKPYQQSTISALISQALFFERNAMPHKKRASS